MSRHLFLADAQREAIETAHFHLDDREIARYWTLSEQDLLRIDRRRRDSGCATVAELGASRIAISGSSARRESPSRTVSSR
jgi:hypothetical protein